MKYEKYLKQLQETKTKPDKKPEVRKTTPRGQTIERRKFTTLSSNVKRQNWND
jgi:hypothetical protein